MTILFFMGLYFLLLVFAGMPMIFAITGPGMAIPFAFPGATDVTLANITATFVNSLFSNNTGLVIILFILSGDVMSKGQITDKIFNVFAYFLGKKKGFMPILTIATCMLYGAISGSAPATTAAIAAMCYPLLVELGYEKAFSAAIIMCAGTLGCIIPPSSLITSISNFTGGLDVVTLYKVSAILGVACGILMIFYCYIRCMVCGNGDQEKINAWVDNLRNQGLGNVIKESVWALMTPVLILSIIFLGIGDAAQAAAISLVYAVLVSIYVYKAFAWKDLPGILRKSLRGGSALLAMVAFANVLSGVMSKLNVTAAVASFITENDISGTAIVLGIMVAVLVLGCCNAASSSFIFPMIYPIILAAGLEPYSNMVGITLVYSTGALTAPVGLCLFIMASMSGKSVFEVGKRAIPYIAIYCIVGIAAAFIPGLFGGIVAGAPVPVP